MIGARRLLRGAGARRSGARRAAPGLAVPMYVHPVLAPAAWQALTRTDLGSGFVVANAASGPGTAPEQAYVDVLVELQAAGVPLVGYVDSAYGDRCAEEVAVDVVRWRRWFGVTGVFIDRVTSRPDDPSAARRLVDGVRSAGATRVVVNPGVVPDASWCRAADAVITFEGTWTDYLAHVPPGWLREVAPETLCHLVHTLPAEVSLADVRERAALAGAGIVGISRGAMPNPWTGHPGAVAAVPHSRWA
ncbi:MAG TPA: spherulation-specific family 4 protein [Kineosporiaceae bacterium]